MVVLRRKSDAFWQAHVKDPADPARVDAREQIQHMGPDIQHPPGPDIPQGRCVHKKCF